MEMGNLEVCPVVDAKNRVVGSLGLKEIRKKISAIAPEPAAGKPVPHGNVLVVGGGGYLGSILVRKLLQAGRAGRVLDSFLYGRRSLAALEGHKGLDIVEAGLMAAAAEESAAARVPVVEVAAEPAVEPEPLPEEVVSPAVEVEVPVAPPEVALRSPEDEQKHGEAHRFARLLVSVAGAALLIAHHPCQPGRQRVGKGGALIGCQVNAQLHQEQARDQRSGQQQ